jgi:K+-sensing histidine kinase KdpD
MERAAVTPHELVSRALEHLTAARVNVDLSAAPEHMFVDAARLARALHNLADNALQATSGAEAIELRVARDGADVLIEVRSRCGHPRRRRSADFRAVSHDARARHGPRAGRGAAHRRATRRIVDG